MPSGPAEGWPEQSITRSAPKPPTISRTRAMRSAGVVTASMSTVASAPNLRASLRRGALRRADADDAARAHLLRRRDRQNADRPGALDDDRVAPSEAAGAGRAVEGADAGGQRLGQRAEPQRHVVGQLVDLGAGQHVEVDIDVLGPAAPQVRRLVEAEIAPVVDRRQALVGVLGVVDAIVAAPARHQRRDHDLRADGDRLAHEILDERRALLDDDAADLVAERERPGQRLRPMPFQDVLIGAADAAGADLDQRRIPRHRRPGHGLDDGLRAGSGKGRDADVGFCHGPTHVIAGLDPAISIACRAACRIVIAGTRPAARPLAWERLDTRHRPRGPFGPSYGSEGSRGCAGRDGSILILDGSLSAPRAR